MAQAKLATQAADHIRHIADLFGDLYAADEVEVWLQTPQAILHGDRPIDRINAGQGDEVVRAVNEILDGILT
jgi:uncharacterized protein (DUF2384 family)